MSQKKAPAVVTDSDDEKSLFQLIQLKKKPETKKLLKKLHVYIENPEKKDTSRKKSQVKKKQYKCSDCEQTGVTRIFRLKDTLESHILSKHGEQSKKLVFVCDVCEACEKSSVFAAKKPFLAHMTAEHGMVVFVCDICTAIFKLKANYKTHVASHNVPLKRDYKCEICNGWFVNKAGYASHRKRFPGPHIKQICPHCGASFSREKHMQNHRCKTLLLREAKQRAEKDEEERKQMNYPSCSSSTNRLPADISVSDQISLQDLQEGADSDQLIIRDLSGQIVPGTQVLHFEISDSEQTQQVYQVNVADWNMVAPFVVRDQMATIQTDRSSSD